MSGAEATEPQPTPSSPPAPERSGADLVVSTLRAVGVDTAFGVPGVHALPNWEAMRADGFRYVGLRTELAAAFAADGFARAGGTPAALFLSTGPGALISLGGVMEASASYVPMIVVASQVETQNLRGARGALHELDEQRAAFEPVVKSTTCAARAEDIPAALAGAWELAATPPAGPTFVEIPADVLAGPAPDVDIPSVVPPVSRIPDGEALAPATALLFRSRAPVIWAGGGAVRAGARRALTQLAERLDAPVVTTFMGKGAIPDDHPLACGAACDEPPFARLLEGADVVLCVGTELGEEATSAYSIEPRGKVIRIDASAERSHRDSRIALCGDAAALAEALAAALPARRSHPTGAERAAALRSELELSLEGQDRALERRLVASVREALPPESHSSWDMTILSYWAARDFPARGGRFLYPVGSGTLGYAWPAAIGAACADDGRPTLAVAGDGGIMYGLAELASARQAGVNASLLVVDDGGYGILREYQRAKYGTSWGVDLETPDFSGVAAAFGVSARRAEPGTLGRELEWALNTEGPALVALEETLRAPTTMP